MGLGMFIVLESELPGVEPDKIDGRAIAVSRHMLDAIAHEEDQRGLGEFVSFSEVEAEALSEDMRFDMPVGVGRLERWYTSAEGLLVVRAIRQHIIDATEEIRDASRILSALTEMETVLEAADAADVRFRLNVEYDAREV